MNSLLFIYDYANELLLRWSCLDLCDYLRSIGHKCHVLRIDQVNVNIARSYDCVIFYRTSSKKCLDLMNELKFLNVPVGYSIDDYVWEQERGVMDKLISAEFYMFSNKYLYDKVPFKKPLLYRAPAAGNVLLDICKNVVAKDENVIKIGYSKGHIPSYSINFLRNFLNKINKNDKTIEFHYWSDTNYFSQHDFIKIINHGYFKGVSDFWKSFRDQGLDILVNPLEDSESNTFNHCKSYPKYLEASLTETIMVAPRIYGYLSVIKNGYNGFFASTVEEAADLVNQLITDTNTLRKLGKNAREDVLKNHTYESSVANYSKDLEEIITNIKNEKLSKKINLVKNNDNHEKVITDLSTSNKNEKLYPIIENIDLNCSPCVIRPIAFGSCFEQQELVNFKYLSGFWVKGATYCNKIINGMKVEVFNKNEIIFSGQISADLMRDNAWWPIMFREAKLNNNLVKIKIYNLDNRSISFYEAVNKQEKAARIGDIIVNPVSVIFVGK